MTLAPVVALNPPAGDQLKVVAPPAVKVVELPLQIVAAPDAMTVSEELTVMVTTDVPVQPLPSVPVTV